MRAPIRFPPEKEDHIATRLLNTLVVRLLVVVIAVISVTVYLQVSPRKGFDGESSLESRQRFVFLKTHKTGSSTVTALILRKCMKEKINCFIPKIERPGKTFDMRSDYMEIKNGRGLYGGTFPYDIWLAPN